MAPGNRPRKDDIRSQGEGRERPLTAQGEGTPRRRNLPPMTLPDLSRAGRPQPPHSPEPSKGGPPRPPPSAEAARCAAAAREGELRCPVHPSFPPPRPPPPPLPPSLRFPQLPSQPGTQAPSPGFRVRPRRSRELSP